MDAPARKQRAITSDKIDLTKPASIVINGRFKGLSRFCALTGYPTSTAHGWMETGYIPAHRKKASVHAHILAVAAEHGIEIERADFVEAPANDAASVTALADGQ